MIIALIRYVISAVIDIAADIAAFVLAALGRMPYEAVFQLVAKMQQQAQSQMAPEIEDQTGQVESE